MSDELIELVRQYRVLYDTKCKEYKDQGIRNDVWEEISKTLNKSVNSCKDEWTKLRNAYASDLKRRRSKKSGQAATTVTPWKYEDQMSFIRPFMESRNTYTNIVSQPESVQSPSGSALESPAASPYHRSESQNSFRSSSSSRLNTGKAGMQELYELMKTSNDLRIRKQNARQERDMDENYLFFLSMSKVVKSLSILEQTKIKLDLHTAVSQAQIRNLEKKQTDKVLQTPINITSYKVIPPRQMINPSQVSPPYEEYQPSLRSSTHSSIDYHPTPSTSATRTSPPQGSPPYEEYQPSLRSSTHSSIDYRPIPSTSATHGTSPPQINSFSNESLATYYNSVDYSDCDI